LITKKRTQMCAEEALIRVLLHQLYHVFLREVKGRAVRIGQFLFCLSSYHAIKVELQRNRYFCVCYVSRVLFTTETVNGFPYFSAQSFNCLCLGNTTLVNLHFLILSKFSDICLYLPIQISIKILFNYLG